MGQLPERCVQPDPVPDAERPSVASLLTLLECVPAMLWETDTRLRLSCLTGTALKAVSISPGLYDGRTIGEFFSQAGNIERIRRAHETALLGYSSLVEVDMNGRDLQAMVRPLRDRDGTIQGTIGIALDMTERMVAERALRLSEQSYRSLIEDAPYAICRSTVHGALLQVNRVMIEMLGYDPACGSELLLRDLPLVFTPAGSFETFQAALMASGLHRGMDSSWLRVDGSVIQVRVSGRVVKDLFGAVSHLDIFAENVTEIKRLESALTQAQRIQAIGQLAGGVAHDFNNLLTVISGQTELLLSESVEAGSRVRLAEIKQAAEKAASLTRQLLAFSRRQVLRSRTVNLNDVIAGLMKMLGRLLKENVELVFVPGEDLGSVNADPNEIERVLLNLSVNAQDAMPEGGRLRIETANVHITGRSSSEPEELKTGDYVQIVVNDTGLGMDLETQARAFEPFFTTKQPTEGTGLGLSVVYGVVRQSGGYIRLESEPGVGTTFRIYFPRISALAEPVSESASKTAVPKGSETILLAEDDAGIRNLIVCTLEGLGYHVLNAPDGEAAISLARSYSGQIHLLISDLVMPAMGGLELARKMQATTPNLKLVFMSGYAGDAVGEKTLDLTGVCFLQKPFSMELLARTVRSAFDR